jgi:hypothetical protein
MNFKIKWFIFMDQRKQTSVIFVEIFSISRGGSSSSRIYMKNPPNHANMSEFGDARLNTM